MCAVSSFAQNHCVQIQTEFKIMWFVILKIEMNFSDSSVSRSRAKVFLRWNSRSMTCVMFSGRCFLYVTFSFQSPDFTHLNAVHSAEFEFLPWRLYCSKWQVLCIVLQIKQQVLKYCCGRLVPDFLHKLNAQQHAQHLEEFAISCEHPVLHLYHCNSGKATTLVQHPFIESVVLYFKTKYRLDSLMCINIHIHSSL